jgi:hypothetical protein
MRGLALSSLFVVALASVAAPALAYRPSARTIVDLMVAKQFERGIKTLVVTATAVEGDRTSNDRITFTTPTTMTVLSDGVAVPPKAGGPPNFLQDALLSGPPLNAAQAEERLMKDLQSLGVDVDLTAYGRVDGRVVYLIGAKSWESDKPMVAIDKESLVVMKVVAQWKGERFEMRYQGWGSGVGGNWYPSSTELLVNGAIVKRTTTLQVEKNPAPAAPPSQ